MERVPDVMLIHAKVHPVLADAPSWGVEGVHLLLGLHDPGVVVVRLARDGEIVELRFDGVDDFMVAGSFPEEDSQLRILDVSHLLWQGVSIRAESVGRGIGFWARSVTLSAGRSERRKATKPRTRRLRTEPR